ncbi:uncharacterized protein LOC142579279 isoform X3 [Dermacentor variabilis]|uniref:uncharacterized protein LOC142579279 isoform X3 n=1 Tax=Dermacentor variabilis TaxID=34621 RepID=UPI003F5C992F
MSDSREQLADNAATSDALSSAPAAVRAPAAAGLRTAATEASAAPKAAAAVVSGTPQRADDRPPPRKRRSSTASQLSQASRSSRSRKKKLKQKPDDDLAQRQPEATPVDGNQTIAGSSSGGVVSAFPAGPPPVDSVIPVGDAVAPAVPPAGPSALASDAIPPAGTVSSADALPPANSGSAATTTGPPAGAAPYVGGSAVIPAAVHPSAKASALVRNAWSLLSPPNTRPLEYDSRRTSMASVAAALVFKPRTPHRWRMNAAIKKTQGSLWLDDHTKAIAIEKFSKARIALWPRGEYLTEDVLERAFESFPRNGTMSLTQLWEETRLVWHALRDTPEAEEDYRLPGSYTQPYARYWYLLNTVRLSLGLLAHPAYHREGTRAMLFGGLGFLFARQLVGAVDGSGIGVDAMGKPVADSWIGDSTVRVNFERRLRCEVDLFPDVPAVEVAFAAFLDGASSGLRLSHRFSEPQVFFLTLCHLTCACGHPDNLYGADCNRVVRNFQPFADAFRCAPGSKMNPTNKCRFFG